MSVEFSIVVPVYNSSESLKELARRIDEVMSRDYPGGFELVFVDDGSPSPEPWKMLLELARKHEFVRAIQLTRNFGRGSAVLAGLSHARGKRIIVMDDDLQHRPEDIPKLLEVEGHDIVFANFPRKNHPWAVRFFSDIKRWFDRILIGVPRGIKFSPFLCMDRQVAEGMLQVKTPYPLISTLLFYVTNDTVAVNVEHDSRKYGDAAFTFVRRLKQFLRLLINNSSFMLQVIAALGGTLALTSIIFGGYVIVKAISGDIAVAGWASLMVVTLFIGGMILFSLGVIGEYLVRIVNSTEQRPAFLVRKVTDASNGSER